MLSSACLPGAFGSSFGDVCEGKKEGEKIIEILKNIKLEKTKAINLMTLLER